MNNIIIICICVAFVGGAYFIGLSNAEKSPPCFVNDEDPPEEGLHYESSIPKVVEGIRSLKSLAESRIHYMNIAYCTTEVNGSFMDITESSFTDSLKFLHDFISNQSLFLETMKGHYDNLNLLANYLEHLIQTANDVSSSKSLVSIQTRVYDVMCSLKMILQSERRDPVTSVPSGILSDIFILNHQDSSICEQQILEYITVLDSKRIARYLESMYTAVSDHLSRQSIKR